MDEQRKTHFQEAAAIVELCELASCPQIAPQLLKDAITVDAGNRSPGREAEAVRTLASTGMQSEDRMNLTDLRELISDLNASPITAFEVDTEDLKLKLSWQRAPMFASPTSLPSQQVRSPLSGVFSLTTGDGPDIAVGDTVEPGRAPESRLTRFSEVGDRLASQARRSGLSASEASDSPSSSISLSGA